MKITKLPKHTDNINTLEDVYKYLKIKEEDVVIFKNPKNAFEKYINACSIIPKIVECYNNGWKPNWSDFREYKYTPYKFFPEGGWSVGYGGWNAIVVCSGGFYYKSEVLSKEAYNKFSSIYEDYWNLNK